jgi:hypothetical protein
VKSKGPSLDALIVFQSRNHTDGCPKNAGRCPKKCSTASIITARIVPRIASGAHAPSRIATSARARGASTDSISGLVRSPVLSWPHGSHGRVGRANRTTHLAERGELREPLIRAFFVKYKKMAKGNPHPVGRRRPGVPNKVSTARVERAIKEGKRLPPEDAPWLSVWSGTSAPPLTHSWRMRSPVSAARRFEVAEAYRAAVARWPAARITLRQGARLIEDSRRLRESFLSRPRRPRGVEG